MHSPIVHAPTVLTLLGGGSVTSEELAIARKITPILVALDGGAEIALQHGITPEAVIGDFDSLSQASATVIGAAALHQIDEQDTTDFEKALARVDAPLMLGVGLTGLRRDHELSAYHALLRFADKRCLLIAQSDVIALCPPKLTLDLPVNTRVSLFPLTSVVADATGLRWPLDALALAPGKRIGTSNAASGGVVEIRVDAPGLLVILPVDKLDALIAGFQANPAGWARQV